MNCFKTIVIKDICEIISNSLIIFLKIIIKNWTQKLGEHFFIFIIFNIIDLLYIIYIIINFLF